LTFSFAAAAATSEPGIPSPPEVLTNLSQLRNWAEHELTNVHPFRIVADVCDVDPVSGVLVLRDATGMEFVHVDFNNEDVKPGARISLEGEGCAVKLQGFGLAVIPGLILEIDGVHGLQVRSSSAFFRAGLTPIKAQWFNHLGHVTLVVECEGPGLPRQPIPRSFISRASISSATGATNFFPGMDYRCYEGTYEYLPDFAFSRPVRTGVVTNFDLNVRTRPENVALEFNGFLSI